MNDTKNAMVAIDPDYLPVNGEGEAAPQEATIFIAEDGSDHTVTPNT